MKDSVIVIGGGIAGLMSAYHLSQNGLKVKIIDKGELTEKTSFGNAGVLSASGKEPLSHPGVLLETILLLLKRQSPLSIKGFPNLKTIIWLWQFFCSASKQSTQERIKAFERYGQESLELYAHLQNDLHIDLDFHKKGYILAFCNAKNFAKKKAVLQNQPQVECLTPSMQEALAPILGEHIAGAFALYNNAHFDPQKVITNLRAYLEQQGVTFIDDDITHLHTCEKNSTPPNNIEAIEGKSGHRYEAGHYIMATGINTSLAEQLGVKLMLIPTKGYSITCQMDDLLKPKLPILFADRFTFMTPRKDDVRITSRLEIGSTSRRIKPDTITAIIDTLQKDTKHFELKDMTTWSGFRPLTPDDKPIIGRDKRFKNFIYATGLGWLGMTLGGAIGRMVSDLIRFDMDNEAHQDIADFSRL